MICHLNYKTWSSSLWGTNPQNLASSRCWSQYNFTPLSENLVSKSLTALPLFVAQCTFFILFFVGWFRCNSQMSLVVVILTWAKIKALGFGLCLKSPTIQNTNLCDRDRSFSIREASPYQNRCALHNVKTAVLHHLLLL